MCSSDLMSTFTRLYSDTAHEGSGARHTAQGNIHPGMHTTETIDYAIILAGEIYAIMDEGEKLMKAGDVLIQRGTNHAWSNRSGKTCRIAFILIDGEFDANLAHGKHSRGA